MRAIKNSIAVVLVVLGLAACGAEKPRAETAQAEAQPAPPKMAEPPVQMAEPPAPPPPVPVPTAASPGEHAASAEPLAAPASAQATRRKLASSKPTPAVKLEDDPEVLVQRLDAYLSGLKTAAYTFNPPSPILVAKPVTVHLWLDPQATAAELAEELKKAIPNDAGGVESGQTRWSPKMRATLSGPDFEVKAVDPEEQLVSSTQRTTWSWDVTPLHTGERLALHLRLAAVMPAEFGPPKTITTLDREIHVDVTWWWLFDHYFEKYWKWLLGSLGTAAASIVAWWWKNKATVGKSA